jgi:hypothetical protein
MGSSLGGIIRQRQLLLATAGTVSGAFIGLAAFELSRLTGAALFVLVGALAGFGAVFVLKPYIGRARLTSLKITVPQVSELTFVVDDEARQVAWRLYIEAATRISTQPLSDGQGNLREALTSLYGLFAITRESLKAGRPSAAVVAGGHSVEYLAITMLNRELRPFLSKWHPLLHEFEQSHPSGPESKWMYNGACREELERVRLNIIDYTLGFGRLANVRDTEAMFSAYTT